MTTYEDTLLAARFAALAPEPLAGNWDEVLDRAGAARKGRGWHERSRALQGRRRRLLVVLAAIALVAVATASAFAVRAFFLDRGFIGLPPKGATPSSPENAELVLFYWGEVPGQRGKSRFWAYDDGRVVSLRAANLPEGANPRSTGYLEQRLTPEGVELLLTEIISIGLIGGDDDDGFGTPLDPADDFAIGSEPVAWDTTEPIPSSSRLQVRDGDQLYTISRTGDLDRVAARIADPASWLPASAWEVREIRAYVPSRYAVCFMGVPPIEPSRLLPLLPERGQGLLRTREFAPDARGGACTDLTTEEARTLSEALDAAGLEPFEDEHTEASEHTKANVLNYRLEIPGSIHVIAFEPYLPHGESPCTPCG